MTLASQTNRVSYTPNGVTDEFAFPYKFLLAADLLVYLVDSDGVGELQTITTDYTVDGAGEEAGGTITFVDPPSADDWESVVIIRNQAPVQPADITGESDSPIAGSVETALDRLAMALQRMQDRLDRTVSAGEFADLDEVPNYDDFLTLAQAVEAAADAIPVNYLAQTVTGDGATEIDFSEGGYVILNIEDNTTLTFTGWPAAGIAARMTIETRNTGAFNVTFPAGVLWLGGNAGSVTSGNGKRDMFVFSTADSGSNIYGHIVGQNFET